MKSKIAKPTKTITPVKNGLSLLLTTAVAMLACLPVFATDRSREHDQDDEETHYQQINLVSDISGVAQLQDTNLVNAWGIAFGPTGPFWIGDNGTGKATLYAVTNDASGAPHVNRQLLEDAPLGLYAVVPPHPEHQIIAPGVMFCLKQKGDATGSDTVNPLQPYYLVYVRDDGTVRFSFAQPKQILEIYRLPCSGKAAAYEQLCQLFDTETKNGADSRMARQANCNPVKISARRIVL